MNRIIFPLEPQMQGPEVADLQAALQLLLDRGFILRDDEGVRRELSATESPRAQWRHGAPILARWERIKEVVIVAPDY